jgi:hypothetical protein
MPRRAPALNLTALLALSALAELIFYRVLCAAFLPAQPSSLVQRSLVGFGSFVSNLSGILGLVLAVTALTQALSSDRIFPRSMRITVTTIGLFFAALSAMSVLWFVVTPRYHIHLRISHGFLVLFLMLGVWRGPHSLRSKVGITLFAMPIVLEAVALFCHRMAWARVEPAQIVRAAHAINWVAMCATPVLVAPRPRGPGRLAVIVASALIVGSCLGVATALRFDLVQTVAFYGLHIDLTGLASSAEQLYTATLIIAVTSLGAAMAGCFADHGPHRLAGWGLLLLAVSGQELSSARPALFALCGLLALAVASARASIDAGTSASPSGAQTTPSPHLGTNLPTEQGRS